MCSNGFLIFFISYIFFWQFPCTPSVFCFCFMCCSRWPRLHLPQHGSVLIFSQPISKLLFALKPQSREMVRLRAVKPLCFLKPTRNSRLIRHTLPGMFAKLLPRFRCSPSLPWSHAYSCISNHSPAAASPLSPFPVVSKPAGGPNHDGSLPS